MSLVRFRPEAPFQKYENLIADLAHLVERDLAKVEVASSNLVIRSICLQNLFSQVLFCFEVRTVKKAVLISFKKQPAVTAQFLNAL